MLALPSQTPGLIAQHGLSRAAVDREVWLIDSAGAKLGGAAAVNRVLEELGGIWSWLSKAFRPAAMFWLEEWAYRWVAAHRYRFGRTGLTPKCERPP